jgi:WD40 repeat protein
MWPSLEPPGGALRRTLDGHTGSVTAVVLSKDGKTAVSGSNDQTLRVWDVETGQERRTLEGRAGEVSTVALSADGKTAVSGSSDKTLKVWDVEVGRERWTLKGHSLWRTAVALSADGKTVVFGWEEALRVWDVEAGQERRTLKGHSDWVRAVALSGDGKMAVSGSDDRMLKVWNLETGRCLASFSGEAAFDAVALSSEMRLFAGDAAGHVHLLELRLGPDRPSGPQS